MTTPAKMAEVLTKLVCIKPHDEMTFCNEFTQIVAQSYGCSDLNGLLSHEQIARVAASPAWREVQPQEAQDLANSGGLVLAGAMPVAPETVAHVCLVVPGKAVPGSEPGWTIMPIVANVGREVWYGKHARWAYPKQMLARYWTWTGNQT